MLFPTFTQTAGQLSILAPPDATILLQGYHMLYLLNGDTPSEASWIRLGDLPQPSISPTTRSTAVPTAAPSQAPIVDIYRQWIRLTGFEYNPLPNVYPSISTYADYTTATVDDCESLCDNGVGCDFYTYNSLTQSCNLKYSDKVASMSTVFKGQASGRLFGQLQLANTINANAIVTTSVEDCIQRCSTTATCQFVVYDYTVPTAIQCWLKFFDANVNSVIGFRENVRPLNYNPPVLGRVDVLGNSGISCEMTLLLPNGKVLCLSKPEMTRIGRNFDNLYGPLEGFPDPDQPDGIHEVHNGEIASVLDPATGLHVPSPVDYNIHGTAAILAEDGTVYSFGGDDASAPSGFDTGPTGGLLPGLRKQRTYDFRSGNWSYIATTMRVDRFLPSVVRLVNGSMMILGGMTAPTSWEPNRDLEVYNPGTEDNTLLPSTLLDSTGTAEAPKAFIIPGSGNIFMFAQYSYAILSKETGLTLETPPWWTPDNGATWLPPVGPTGRRSGNYAAGNCLLPIHASRGYNAEFALFGGANSDDANRTAQNNVARVILTTAAMPKQWTYDSDRMPYGRVASDCTLQPNGKMLITNGARLGISGGYIGGSTLFAAANGLNHNTYIHNLLTINTRIPFYFICRHLLLRPGSSPRQEVHSAREYRYPALLSLDDALYTRRQDSPPGHRSSNQRPADCIRTSIRSVYPAMAARRHSQTRNLKVLHCKPNYLVSLI